jgi:hypothetical protein
MEHEANCPSCPVCAATVRDACGEVSRRPGDGTFCMRCGEPLRFDADMRLRVICAEELALFMAHDVVFRLLHAFTEPLRVLRSVT